MSSTLKALESKAAGVIAVALPLSLVIFTYERELVPLYGSSPINSYLDKFVIAFALLSAIHPFRVPFHWNFLASAILLSAAPNATYWVAVFTARRLKDPVIGPAILHSLVLGPLVFALTTFVVELEDPDAKEKQTHNGRPPLVLRMLRGSMTFLISFLLFQRIWYPSLALANISGSQIFLALAGGFYVLWIGSLQLQPVNRPPQTKKANKSVPASSFSNTQIKAALITLFVGAWFKAHTFLANPVLPHPLNEAHTHSSYPLRILFAEQSVTGLITVAEWLPPADYNGEYDAEMHSARYLRASHSLLGGVWTHRKVQTLGDIEPLKDSAGAPLGDSIYSTFILQEASRLVDSTDVGKNGKWKNALIIGLGTGVSATAFMRHGIQTTIVEIDPAVYKAARKFFGLPEPGEGRVFIEDARTWVAERRTNIRDGQQELYEIVVNDCFSGGGVPQHIFTVEFWDDLASLMTSDGTLVVNFAGMLKSTSSRLVINTLERKFGKCRAFHDSFDAISEAQYDTDFINMVIFCSKSSTPITFRETKESDWLGSPLRRHVLQSLDQREVNLDTVRTDDDRYILTDQQNALGFFRTGRAVTTVMREVLPDVHWETY